MEEVLGDATLKRQHIRASMSVGFSKDASSYDVVGREKLRRLRAKEILYQVSLRNRHQGR